MWFPTLNIFISCFVPSIHFKFYSFQYESGSIVTLQDANFLLWRRKLLKESDDFIRRRPLHTLEANRDWKIYHLNEAFSRACNVHHCSFSNLFAKSEFPSAGFAIDVSNVDKLRKIQSHLNKYLLSSSLNYFFSRQASDFKFMMGYPPDIYRMMTTQYIIFIFWSYKLNCKQYDLCLLETCNV